MESGVAAKYRRRPFLSGKQPSEVFQKLAGQQAVVVSEPFANKHHVKAGDKLTLDLGEKKATFLVADVYYDYSSERGMILMDRATLFQYLPDQSPTNVAVYLKPGVSLDDGQKAVEAALAEPVSSDPGSGDRRVMVAQNRFLREQAIVIFDRTFAITYALEAVAVFVAIVGVGGALLALVIDRRREFGLLKFLGAAESQVRRIILFEAGLLGILANLAGIVLGFFLSLLLIYVINKQSFGWTIQFHWPIAVLLSALTIVYSATVLAGLYPARIATKLVPIEVIHEE
jgi:putative ABC transport system permease protein